MYKRRLKEGTLTRLANGSQESSGFKFVSPLLDWTCRQQRTIRFRRATRFSPPPSNSRIPSRDRRGNLRIEVREPEDSIRTFVPRTAGNDVYAKMMIGVGVACL